MGGDPDSDWSALVPADEIREFLSSARPQLASLFPFSGLRALLDGGTPSLAEWSQLVESGYTVIGLPEAVGGFGSAVDLAAVLEEAGRALLPVPLLATAASMQTLLVAGLSADGTVPMSLVIAPPGAVGLEVFDGRLVEELVLVREEGSGVSISRVALGPAPRGEGVDPVDPSRAQVSVAFDEADVLETALVPGVTIDQVLAAARTCVAADLLGVAASALDGAIAHALVREQFGRPIGSLQGVKHLLANAFVAIERARSLTVGAAAAVASDPLGSSSSQLSLLAKSAASEAATRATALQVQLFGAMGLTFESDAPLALRRAQQTVRYLGTASELSARAAAGFLADGSDDRRGETRTPSGGALDEFRAFLADALPADYDARYRDYLDDEPMRTAFQAAEFDAGWLVPEWPRELGGRELPLGEALTIRIEGARRRIPRQMNVQATGVVAPGIRRWGTPAQQEKYLRPTLRGEAWWALGMSEPGAGSDLAGLRTTAVRTEAGFVVNGQKVWTTQADEARWCTLYVRTDPAKSKHRGISCLIVDMDSPGIEVRTIRTAGSAVESFCEVFFDDVVVPAENLLGELDGGWLVAVSGLESERDMIWINNWLEMQRALEPIAASAGVAEYEHERLGRLLGDTEAIRLTGLRSVALRAAGIESPIAGILKLFGSEAVQAATQFAFDVGSVDAGGRPRADLFDDYLESMAATIYGGTSEVQRNIIAERILGLPKGN
jgi:alkylation response protein AidB-like acyl-CoA dehydrogenase